MKQYLLCLFVVFFLSVSYELKAQDTILLMNYNVDDYGFPPTQGCTLQNPLLKHPYLRTIMEYENPDIVGLVKMDANPSSFTTDTVISEVLDSACAGCWGHSPFTNNSGYTKENMLYYKTAKFGFVSTTTIYSADPDISDIDMHRLFYKSADLATTHDTSFINIILLHDKSGNDPSDSAQRSTEVSGAMDWLSANITAPGNYIFMGDFNTQTANEGCFQAAINSSNGNTKFTDASGQIGDWSADPGAYAHYLTESTRTTDPGDCSNTGGMVDIFDHILCTSPVMQGSQYVKYVPGSYKVVGQDGQHTGIALNASPPNAAAPSNVINALYYMSEHLPVTINLAVGPSLTSGVTGVRGDVTASLYPNPNNGTFILQTSGAVGMSYMICDVLGQMVKQGPIESANQSIDLPGAPEGIYTLVAGDTRIRFIVK